MPGTPNWPYRVTQCTHRVLFFRSRRRNISKSKQTFNVTKRREHSSAGHIHRTNRIPLMSQIISEITEYTVLYTADVHKKLKSWNDGTLTHFKFNCKVQVHSEDGILITEQFKHNVVFEQDKQVRVGRVLVEIMELRNESTRDIGQVFKKQDRALRTPGPLLKKLSSRPTNPTPHRMESTLRRRVGLSKFDTPSKRKCSEQEHQTSSMSCGPSPTTTHQYPMHQRAKSTHIIRDRQSPLKSQSELQQVSILPIEQHTASASAPARSFTTRRIGSKAQPARIAITLPTPSKTPKCAQPSSRTTTSTAIASESAQSTPSFLHVLPLTNPAHHGNATYMQHVIQQTSLQTPVSLVKIKDEALDQNEDPLEEDAVSWGMREDPLSLASHLQRLHRAAVDTIPIGESTSVSPNQGPKTPGRTPLRSIQPNSLSKAPHSFDNKATHWTPMINPGLKITGKKIDVYASGGGEESSDDEIVETQQVGVINIRNRATQTETYDYGQERNSSDRRVRVSDLGF